MSIGVQVGGRVPRILIDAGTHPAEAEPLSVFIAGRPYWSPTAPSIRGTVDIAGLRAAFQVHGEGILNHLDGAFAVLVRSGDDTFAVTDRFNVVPLYMGRAYGRIALSTDTDSLARHLGIESNLDLVSMAQALQMWYATHPYTFYRGIRELDPASVYRWNRNGEVKQTRYWEAQYRGDTSNKHAELAEELAAAIKQGVQKRVRESDRPGLLLSAGADSRGVLFAAAEIRPITCYTFYDQPNAELEGARRLAGAAGQEHVALRRGPEHYGLSARLATQLSGGMWSFLDAHSVGFADQIAGDDLLLTGDFADLLFKGNGFDVRYLTLAGKALPLKAVSSFHRAWRRPRAKIDKTWKSEISDRLDEQYNGIDVDSGPDEVWWAIAHRRVGALSRTPSYCGIATMQRVSQWDTFMADSAMAFVYEKLTISARINAGVWEGAIRSLTPHTARRIANNNVLAPVGASDAEKVARFLYGVAYRKIMKREFDGTPLDGSVTRGSWPNWGHYMANSPVIGSLWDGISPDSRDVIRELRGDDPWQIPQTDHARDSLGFGRLLTQALWLDLRKKDA